MRKVSVEKLLLIISYAGTDHSGSGNTDDLVLPIELCIRTRLNELYKLNVIIVYYSKV